jgi:lipoate-protein ligase A
MKLLDLTLSTPAENLACEEVLLGWAEAERLEGILRFWEPTSNFVVVGYANEVAKEVDVRFCEEAGVPVLRRFTGGGTVVQMPGCLNYAVILPYAAGGPLRTIHLTNEFVLRRVADALQELAPGPIELRGHTDLAVGGRKFSGNAQRRSRDYLVFHGSLLLKADLAFIERALRMPSKEPDYRTGRSHRDFLVNLNLAAETVKAALAQAWGVRELLRELPRERIRALAVDKYSKHDWNWKF